MGEARRRGTFEERRAAAATRAPRGEVVISQLSTKDLIRRFGRSVRGTPLAHNLARAIRGRARAGDALAGDFLQAVPELQARTPAAVSAKLNAWFAARESQA